MESVKETAVNWIIHNIVEDQIIKAKSMSEWVSIFEQAKEMEKDLYICNKCKSQINEKEIMQQVQDSKKTD